MSDQKTFKGSVRVDVAPMEHSDKSVTFDYYDIDTVMEILIRGKTLIDRAHAAAAPHEGFHIDVHGTKDT